MRNFPLPRVDRTPEVRSHLFKYCRLKEGEIWHDPSGKHRLGCLDAANSIHIQRLMNGARATLAIHDPPYNLVAFEERELSEFISWCKRWVENTEAALTENSSLYVWLGADQTAGFQPLPDFMVMMRSTSLRPRSFITMRNSAVTARRKIGWRCGRNCSITPNCS
jgi:site-specific DNA-methyltransferase (adenine-specific)